MSDVGASGKAGAVHSGCDNERSEAHTSSRTPPPAVANQNNLN